MIFREFVEMKRVETIQSGSVSFQHGLVVGGQKTPKMFHPQLSTPSIISCCPYDPSGRVDGIYICRIAFAKATTVLREPLDQLANLCDLGRERGRVLEGRNGGTVSIGSAGIREKTGASRIRMHEVGILGRVDGVHVGRHEAWTGGTCGRRCGSRVQRGTSGIRIPQGGTGDIRHRSDKATKKSGRLSKKVTKNSYMSLAIDIRMGLTVSDELTTETESR